MIYMSLLLKLVALSAPAIIGLYIAKNGTDKSRKYFWVGLNGYKTLLLGIWPFFVFYLFMGFAIGGGNPTILQIMAPVILVTSPLPLAAAFTLFSVRRLKNSLQR